MWTESTQATCGLPFGHGLTCFCLQLVSVGPFGLNLKIGRISGWTDQITIPRAPFPHVNPYLWWFPPLSLSRVRLMLSPACRNTQTQVIEYLPVHTCPRVKPIPGRWAPGPGCTLSSHWAYATVYAIALHTLHPGCSLESSFASASSIAVVIGSH